MTPTKTFNVNGRHGFVYDNTFGFNRRLEILDFILNSVYRPTGSDVKDLVSRHSDYQMHSVFSEDDVKNIGFFDSDKIMEIASIHDLDRRQLKHARVNLGMLGEKNRVHTDGEGVTLIYYANIEWDVTWGGHTHFLNESADEIEMTVTNKSGRIVVFDGMIPHLINTPSVLSPIHRFTFALQYF